MMTRSDRTAPSSIPARQREMAQFRPEVTMNAGRQRRRNHLGGLPMLAAAIHDIRMDHQILYRKARAALKREPRGGAASLTKLRPRAAPRPPRIAARGLRLGRLLHPARF